MPFSNIYHASLHNDPPPTTSLQLVSILKIPLKQFQSLWEVLRKFRSWTLCITGLGNCHIYHIQSLCLYGSRAWKIFLHASKCFIFNFKSFEKKNWISIACYLYFLLCPESLSCPDSWLYTVHNPDCISGLGFFSYYLGLLGLQHRLLRLKFMTHI